VTASDRGAGSTPALLGRGRTGNALLTIAGREADTGAETWRDAHGT